MRFPSRAHQSEHSATCCMRSPALPENKTPLLLPSFAFSGKSISSRFRFLSLADLHHVSAITAERWATTPPPPSLPHASILASPCGARWLESSPVPVRKLIVPRSMPALRRVDQRQHVHAMPKRHTPHHPFWARCISHFHLLLVTTPHTQVSLVSIRHRTGRSAASWLAVAELLSAGFRPQRVALVDACCVVLVPLSKDDSPWSNLSYC